MYMQHMPHRTQVDFFVLSCNVYERDCHDPLQQHSPIHAQKFVTDHNYTTICVTHHNTTPTLHIVVQHW